MKERRRSNVWDNEEGGGGRAEVSVAAGGKISSQQALIERFTVED